MKKYFLMILLLLFFFTSFSVQALVNKSSDIFVTDEAHIISQNTKNYIIQYSDFLKKEENIDYYVVTLSSLENISLEEYANYIYDSFYLGKNGLLIVVCKNERNLYIKAGEGLTPIITNEMIDQYIKKYFIPYFKTGDWNQGIHNGYSAFYKKICEYYDIDASSMEVDTGDVLSKYQSFLLLIIVWVCTIFGYVYGKYFNRLFLTGENSFGNHAVFAISLFINILLLYYCFFVKALAIIIIIGFEGLIFFNTVDNHIFMKKKKKIKKRKKKTKKR